MQKITQNIQRIVWVGGSYGGLPSIKRFVQLFQTLHSQGKVDLTKEFELYLIDPRAGFLNILGIPKAIIDTRFASEIYATVDSYNFNFKTVESNDSAVVSNILNAKRDEKLPRNLNFHFIHGKVTSFLNDKSLLYQLNDDTLTKVLDFDYAVFATGRSRKWPYDPVARTREEFVDEVNRFKAKVDNANTIAVVGGGALGIELAGEIVETYNSNEVKKKVILIHPHHDLPPEVYAAKRFKTQIVNSILDTGIELRLNTRIAKELPNGDLLTTSYETIKTDLTLWSNSHRNNTKPLLPYFNQYIDPVKNEVIVNKRFLMEGYPNIFVIGDIINLPIIKTAGSAWRQGELVSQSLINLAVLDEMEHYEETTVDENSPKAMTIVIGSHIAISQWDDAGDGTVVVNDERVLEYYKDYYTAYNKGALNIG